MKKTGKIIIEGSADCFGKDKQSHSLWHALNINHKLKAWKKASFTAFRRRLILLTMFKLDNMSMPGYTCYTLLKCNIKNVVYCK